MIWYEFRYPNGLSTHGNYIRMAHTVVLSCVLLWLDTGQCYNYSPGVFHWAHRWAWWRHQWKHFLRYWPFVMGILPSQRPVTWSFGVVYLRLNERMSKQSRNRWFETPSRSLRRHCNGLLQCQWSNSAKYCTHKSIRNSQCNQGKIKHNHTFQIIIGGTSAPIHFYINNHHNHKIGSCLAR